MSNISNSDSTYGTGGLDTRTTLDGTFDATFQQMNGAASAAIAVETILGDGPTLKGNKADLVARLAVAHNADGEVGLNTNGAFAGSTDKYGLIADTPNKKLVPKNIAPIGALLIWCTDTAPTHWLFCAGQAVSRTTYADLFAIISTTYGAGDGSTTFNVPDLRGRVPMGQDDMGGSDAARVTAASTGGANADTLGGVGGAETHTLTASQTPVLSAFVSTALGGATTALSRDTTASATTNQAGMVNTTGGGAHSNTQPWIALNYIIYAGA